MDRFSQGRRDVSKVKQNDLSKEVNKNKLYLVLTEDNGESFSECDTISS